MGGVKFRLIYRNKSDVGERSIELLNDFIRSFKAS